jgi:flagellar biogenesis protein FliO
MNVSDSAGAQFGGSVDAHVRFTLRNSGNTVLSPRTSVVLTSPFGTPAQRSYRIDQLLPGSSVSYAVAIGGVDAYGHLQARVTAASVPVSASATTAAWLLPWGLLVILLLLLVLLCVGAWLLVRRLRQRPRRGRHRQAHRSSPSTSLLRATDGVVVEDEEHKSSFAPVKEAPSSTAGRR